MNTAKIYYDSAGDECTILQMVEREPHWAANRIQDGESAAEERDRLCEKVKHLEYCVKNRCEDIDRLFSELTASQAALSLTEAILQYEREKNLRAEKSLGEARKLTVGGREW